MAVKTNYDDAVLVKGTSKDDGMKEPPTLRLTAEMATISLIMLPARTVQSMAERVTITLKITTVATLHSTAVTAMTR